MDVLIHRSSEARLNMTIAVGGLLEPFMEICPGALRLAQVQPFGNSPHRKRGLSP
jgi:hypothetical protein